MRKLLAGFGLGIAGIAVALGLTLGALAVAGPAVGDPPSPPVLQTGDAVSSTPSPSDAGDDRGDNREDDRDDPKGDATVSPGATPSVDDRASGGSGSDDHDGDDHPGPGGDDDSPDDD